MYIIYNKDGSIQKINLTDFIMKGNNNVNFIFLTIDDVDKDEWAASVYFELPNNEHDIEIVTPLPSDEEIDNKNYSGWKVFIPSAVTAYEGNVKFSVQVLNLNGQVLYTYSGTLVINPSSIVPEYTTITVSQYNALLQYILSLTFPGGEIIFATEEEIEALFA